MGCFGGDLEASRGCARLGKDSFLLLGVRPLHFISCSGQRDRWGAEECRENWYQYRYRWDPKPAAGGQRGLGGTPEVLVDFPFRLGLIDSSLELNALKGGRMQIKKGSKLSLRFACSLETKRKMLALSIFLLKY